MSRDRIAPWSTLLGLALLGALATLPVTAGRDADGAKPVPVRAPLQLAEMSQGGADGPYFASALSTCGDGPLPASAFLEAQTCAGCHPREVEEWSSSAHHRSGLDNPWYRSVYQEALADRGEATAKWCAGCHTPALLATGAIEDPRAVLASDDPLATVGVSCLSCHGAREVRSVMGQADVELCPPEGHAELTHPDPEVRAAYEASVMADPEPHRRAYAIPAGGPDPEARICASCHVGFMDEPINGHFGYPIFDDYSLWQLGAHSGQTISRSIAPTESASCVDCHMPPSPPPAAGGEGAEPVRSHRFAASNTALPAYFGDEEQLRAVTEFLKSDRVALDIFALSREAPPTEEAAQEGGEDEPTADGGEDLWAPLDRSGVRLVPGESVRVDVVVWNKDTGHSFPAGKIDLPDVWLELVAEDAGGRKFFWSGRAEEGRPADPRVHRYVVRMADEEGRRLARHDLWRLRSVPWQRLIEDGDSDVAHYRIEIPETVEGPVTLTARLNYRTLAPELARGVLGEDRAETFHAPIVVMAEDEVRVPLAEGDGGAPRPAAEAGGDSMVRWRNYALALLIEGQRGAAAAAFQRALEINPSDLPSHVGLAWAQRVSEDLEGAKATLERARRIDPDDPRVRFSLGLVERGLGRSEAAVELYRSVAAEYPRDVDVQRFLAGAYSALGDFESAVTHYRAALAADPRQDRVHLGLVRAYTALGDDEAAAYHQAIFEKFQVDQVFRDAAQEYFERVPGEFDEPDRAHEHGPDGEAKEVTGASEAAPAPAEETGGDPGGTGESAEGALFFDVTERSGVAWRHETGAFGERWLPETMGPGAVLFDADGDERLDLLFLNGRSFEGQPEVASTPALYLNQGELRFEEATAERGLDFSAYCLGGAAADYDNDGDQDLYLACLGRDRLLRNDGERFEEVGEAAGLSTEYAFGSSVAFFDADRDGLLDVYAARYVDWTPETDIHCASYGPGKSYCTPAVYRGATARFYRNRGDGTFEDRTEEAGLLDTEAKALGVVPLDFDADGWIDLAVACDTVANRLYRNRGDGTFEDVALAAGVALSSSGRARGGMGIDAADYDLDGRTDLVISYFARDMVGLYKNQGAVFLDQGSMSPVGRNTRSTLGWGTFFFDYDLDGWLDLLVANGHLDEKAENVEGLGTYAQAQQLFRNQGEGRFEEVTETAGGDLARPLVARGAAFGDLDGDGDLDLVITTNGGPAKVFENRLPPARWVRVGLQGTESNRDGLGARITVRAGGRTQSWLVRTGGSYLSQSQVEPVFGLGEATAIDEIEVVWPSGEVQTATDVEVGERVLLVEPAVRPRREASGVRPGTR